MLEMLQLILVVWTVLAVAAAVYFRVLTIRNRRKTRKLMEELTNLRATATYASQTFTGSYGTLTINNPTITTGTAAANFFTPLGRPFEPEQSFFTPQPILAYRAFDLTENRLMPLTGSGFDAVSLEETYLTWYTRPAFCIRSHSHTANHGPAPAWGCTCGFYALKEFPNGQFIGQRGHSGIWAAVLLYGRVIEHEEGYRAERMHIVGFDADRMVSRYGLDKNQAYPPTEVARRRMEAEMLYTASRLPYPVFSFSHPRAMESYIQVAKERMGWT